MLDLEFIAANANVPRGKIVTSARKGPKWSEAVKPGDVVFLKLTESKAVFGRAAIVTVELTTYAKTIETAADNLEASNVHDGETPQSRLTASLEGAYGPDIKADEPFTKLGLIVLND